MAHIRALAAIFSSTLVLFCLVLWPVAFFGVKNETWANRIGIVGLVVLATIFF